MLIYDDKLFAEIEVNVYFRELGIKYEISERLLKRYTIDRVGYENEWYYRVENVDYVLDRAFDWRMNRGDFVDDKIDILDKTHWWFYRSYNRINQLREALDESKRANRSHGRTDSTRERRNARNTRI